MQCSQTVSNMIDQATVEVNVIFGSGNGWCKNSAPPSGPLTLDISGGAVSTMTEQAMTFAAGGNSPNAGKTAAPLHRTLMGGTPMQHIVRVGNNGVRGAAATVATTTASTAAGKQKFVERGSTVWFALTADVKIFGPAATTQEFLKKLLKWKADVGGEYTKCATFKTQDFKTTNLQVF